MSLDGNKGDELCDLILAHLDGKLGDEGFAVLQERLERDPVARKEYARLARIDGGLRAGEADPAEVISFPGRTGSRSVGRVIVPWVAAACVVLGAGYWLFSQSENFESESGSFSANADPEHRSKGVAVITAQSEAVWEKHIGEGASLEPGVFVLKSGLAQIDFFGGASISLSGPATIELVSRDEAILHRGRLRADVPPAARGFQIFTGDIRIEDLGTSFGLAVGEGNDADLVVFDGEVRATGKDGEAVAILGGEAAELRNKDTVVKSTELVSAFPTIKDIFAGEDIRNDSRYASWKEASLQLRNDPRLVAYYDFENLSPASRRLKNRTSRNDASELDGGIVGARVAEGRWPGKTSLDFRQEGDRVRFAIPGEFENLSLFAWVRIDALDRNLNSLFLTDYYDEREFHWQVSKKGALHFACSPKGVENLLKNNRRFYSDCFWSTENSGQWFAFATSVDREKGKVTHYINGESVGFSGGTNMEKPLPVMRIGKADLGNWSDPIWPDVSIRTLNGRIDEFAIFQEALSASEIKELYEQGKP